LPAEISGACIFSVVNTLSCNVYCSAGEELLWHYALHHCPRQRLADTVHDLSFGSSSSCTSPRPLSSSDDEDALSDEEEEVISEGNWPSLYPLHHNQIVIATAPMDGHQVRGHLTNMTGRHSESGFVAKSFEIFESSTGRQVICDADEYNVDTVADTVTPAKFRDVVVPELSSHVASTAVATSPSATTLETISENANAVVFTEASHVTPTPQNAAEPTPTSLQHNYDEEEDDEQSYHNHAVAFKVGDTCSFVEAVGKEATNAVIVGRIIGSTSGHVQKYVLAKNDGSQCVVPSVFVMEPRAMRENEDDPYLHDDGLPEESIANIGAANESGSMALQLAGSIEYFDVAKMNASEMWHSILLKRNLSGGMLTRTILLAATTDHACQPLWTGVTTMEKTKAALASQGVDFITHFTPHHKVAWLRAKLFTTVVSNRHTYSKLRLTFNGHTQLSLAAAGSPELTDDLRCRIAAMALDANCVKLLGIIFGSRDNLEKTDNKSLSNAALWDVLARNFVNNRQWVPHSGAADTILACRLVDTTPCPSPPGLDATTVQDVFLDCRSDWARLKSAVYGVTGCNSTGTQLLKDVWDNYVNGGRLKFQHKVVAMHIFATWTDAGRNLPELCNRTLAEHQQLKIGVQTAKEFTTPQKPHSSSNSSSSTKQLNRNALTDIAQALQRFTGSSSSPINVDDTPEQQKAPKIGAKRLLLQEEPDAELKTYLTSQSIMKWWPDIYERLGITTIADLRFIGKIECLASLADLPALARLKMASLADTTEKPSKLPLDQ
jgi:hypothetical protein